jgi:hypothetical protein
MELDLSALNINHDGDWHYLSTAFGAYRPDSLLIIAFGSRPNALILHILDLVSLSFTSKGLHSSFVFMMLFARETALLAFYGWDWSITLCCYDVL